MAGHNSPKEIVLQNDAEQLKVLAQEMYDYCLFQGNMMKIHTDPVGEPHKAHISSTTLYPSVYSKKAYEHGLEIQPLYNTLYHRIAMDREFLLICLENLGKHDEFIQRHLNIYNKLQEENIVQKVHLGLMRSDYLCHHDKAKIKQVEMNTMSAAASGVNRSATRWHKYMAGTLLGLDSSQIPDNTATNMLARAMVKAWELYANPSAVIVFFVGEKEFNFADQRSLQYEIHGLNPKIRIVRVTFKSMEATLNLTEDRQLFIEKREVAVFYYRYGYAPTHYISDKYWDLRLDVERSKAIKCPSINYLLAGTKRIQQAIACPGVLERWLDQPSANRIRETFVGLYSLEGDGVRACIEMVEEAPDEYVLKPQRDGGGNNFYGAEMLEKIKNSNSLELSSLTLMEKIQPPAEENIMVSGLNPLVPVSIVSELGIFGAIIVGDKDEELMNESAGFLFRSKPKERTEGDLMRGTSSLDSPWLV